MPSTSISKFTGSWSRRHAAHLLRRTIFGPTSQQIANAVDLGLDGTVQQLLNNVNPLPAEPVNYRYDDDPNVPLGTSWVSAEFTSGKDYQRRRSHNAWEVGNMINQADTISAKLTMFWFNHFVTEATAVSDARAFYKFIQIFRENGLGNFRDLVNEVTVSMAMLIYLNGNVNKNTAPNENYARELLELFTVGKGELVEAGNYTNYTEQDIIEASRVLTGYKTTKNPLDKVEYVSSRHDKGSKEFSAAFQNEVIENGEQDEYNTLVDMILRQKETARFITRKIYRWFLYYEITAEVETNIIEPLADILYQNNYEIRPLLETFFSSQHFHDEFFWATQIKSPVDFNIGVLRQLQVSFPASSDFHNLYSLWYKVYQDMVKQQQDISSPPDVSGWKAYYQEPLFYRTWINSVTLPIRQDFVNLLLNNRIKYDGIPIVFDPFDIVDQLMEPEDPNRLIEQLGDLFYQIPLSQEQYDDFKEVLIPGLPDFEWTIEYGDYKANPGDETIKLAVKKKLTELFTSMLNRAEYQLC